MISFIKYKEFCWEETVSYYVDEWLLGMNEAADANQLMHCDFSALPEPRKAQFSFFFSKILLNFVSLDIIKASVTAATIFHFLMLKIMLLAYNNITSSDYNVLETWKWVLVPVLLACIG